tara:strand:+ start:684 stop:866 length:183 start_codon:yes stop_codon:yes gene_type:complete
VCPLVNAVLYVLTTTLKHSVKLILRLAVIVTVDRNLDARVRASVAEGEWLEIFHVVVLGW